MLRRFVAQTLPLIGSSCQQGYGREQGLWQELSATQGTAEALAEGGPAEAWGQAPQPPKYRSCVASVAKQLGIHRRTCWPILCRSCIHLLGTYLDVNGNCHRLPRWSFYNTCFPLHSR